MSTEYLKLGLDLVILAGLGGFIYYALRLSSALNAFRAHRNEFDAIMKQLGQQIYDAQKSVSGLKAASQGTAEDLHKLILESQSMADELRLMTEAGNSLARRLENLAERNSRIAQGMEDEEEFIYGDNVSSMPRGKPARSAEPKEKEFMILDREFEDEEEDFIGDESGFGNDDAALGKLGSEAEKELYRALKKKKRKA